MSTCSIISCVVGRGCLLWPVHSLDKTLLAFALLNFVLLMPIFPVTPGVSLFLKKINLVNWRLITLQYCNGFCHTLTSGISWLPTFAFQSPMMKRTFVFFWCYYCKLLYVFMQPFSFFGISGWDIGLVTVMLNGLPCKWTEMILSFLRWHPSTAFQVEESVNAKTPKWYVVSLGCVK